LVKKLNRIVNNLLVQNLPSLFIVNDDLHVLEIFPIYINWDGPGSGGTFDKNEPTPLVLGKTQEISFPINFKIHFVASPNSPSI
jgi:hypothetical protein